MQRLNRLGIAAAMAYVPFIVSAADSMDNLIIRASRTPQAVPEVGNTVSVIDRELIERRKPVFVTDLLQDVPGIAVSRLGGFGAQTQVRIRGAEANQVLVMIDGVEANDPAAGDAFSFEQTSWDVERIEVIRGPQSALWGSDAMAGVINIVTRRTEEPLRVGAFAEGGSFTSRTFGAHIGSDFGRGSIDVSASAYDTDGNNISRTGGENDGYENASASLHTSLRLSDSWSWSVFGRYSDTTTEFDDVDFVTGLPADSPLKSDVALALIRTTTDLALLDGRWNHRAQLTYSVSDRDNKDARPGNDPVDFDGDKYGAYYQTSFDFGSTARMNRLTLAVDHERDEYQQRGPIAFGDPNQNQKMHNTGLVAEYLLQPLDAMNLSASVRYDENSDFDSAATYRFAGTWRFDGTGTRLHASAGKGQKSPTFTERFGFFPGDFAGNPNLRPEESVGFDVGVVQSAFDSRIQLELTYFYDKVDNEINGFVFDPVTGRFTAANEDGTSHRTGVEFALHARLPAGLDASASYTYTNAKEPDLVNGGNRREIRRPRNMAAGNLNYRLLDERVNLNLNVSYSGKQKDDYFPPPDFAQTRVQLDDYTLLDIVASYAINDKFSVYGRAENLLDEDYENVLGYSTPGTGYYAGIRMRLR
jgi:vitamin B12 transporter